MYRITIKGDHPGVMVKQVDVKAETQAEAMEWIKQQMAAWGVPAEKIQESVQFEKLELLLETR